MAQENKEKHVKDESNFSELTVAIDLIPDKFDSYERKIPEENKITKKLKSQFQDW